MCRASETGDLDKIKQIFKFVEQEKLRGNDMGFEMNILSHWSELVQPQNPRLVDTSSGVDGKTPLILAAENGHIDVCEYLITHQMANLKANNDNQYSAKLLCRASETGDLEKVKQIFNFVDQKKTSGNEMGVEMNILSHWLEPVQPQNPRLVDTSSGADGKTPLILAAENGHIDVCDYLITHQMADLNANDNNHYSALIHASWNNQIEVTKVLVNHSVNINYQGAYTAAHLATQKGHLEVLKILEEKGF